MPISMTGYGRHETKAEGWTFTWEIKSVNGRFLDVKWRLPGSLRSLENAFEKVVRTKASRGRVDISLNLEVHSQELLNVSLNIPHAMAMLQQVSELAKAMGEEYRPDLNRVLGMSYLWKDANNGPDEGLSESLFEGLNAALDDWNNSRRVEGEAMAADLNERLVTLRNLATEITGFVPGILETRLENLRTRISDILEQMDVKYTEERMLQEVAILTDKLDVSEEITRLDAHLERLGEVLATDDQTGKKLDFLLQETFREINTCGNKCQSTDVSKLVVDFKAELEKCREQVQNIE